MRKNRTRTAGALLSASILALSAAAGGFTSATAENESEAVDSSVSFVLTDGRVIPGEDYAMRVDIIGTAFTSSGVPQPITLKLHVGDETAEPFGDADSTAGDVNKSVLPVTSHVFPSMRQAEESITITATSWSGGDKNLTRNSHDQSAFVKVLRNGDAVPNIEGFDNQENAAYFLRPYLTPDGSHVWLHDTQVIYLFEVGTTDATSDAADFQDVVVLVTLGESVIDVEEPQPPRNSYAVPMRSPLLAD
ncbi:MAG: hypothetical protein ED559_02330 [Phycisphaera sp.]|nr:MAG: hypothetical protein ED559_02330 [Phycisphaera sp.]